MANRLMTSRDEEFLHITLPIMRAAISNGQRWRMGMQELPCAQTEEEKAMWSSRLDEMEAGALARIAAAEDGFRVPEED